MIRPLNKAGDFWRDGTLGVFFLTQPMDPGKKSLNFIFPTKYVVPKSLKFSHWLSEFWGIPNFSPPLVLKLFAREAQLRKSMVGG